MADFNLEAAGFCGNQHKRSRWDSNDKQGLICFYFADIFPLGLMLFKVFNFEKRV